MREHLYAKLSAAGIDCIGTTPDAGEATHGECMRPCEIGAWIKNWHQDKGRQRITSFVAVDDRSLLHEKGGSILRGAPPPSGIGTPPPPPPAPIASMGTPSTCRRRDTHVDRPFRTDQCGARLDEVRCHAHDRPAARETRPDLRISRKPPLRDTRACRCDQIRPAPQSSERECRILEKAGPVHLRDERAQPRVRFTLSVAIPMSMCLHMHTCTAHTTRIKSFVQIVTADAIVQNVTAVEAVRTPPPIASPQTRRCKFVGRPSPQQRGRRVGSLAPPRLLFVAFVSVALRVVASACAILAVAFCAVCSFVATTSRLGWSRICITSA